MDPNNNNECYFKLLKVVGERLVRSYLQFQNISPQIIYYLQRDNYYLEQQWRNIVDTTYNIWH